MDKIIKVFKEGLTGNVNNLNSTILTSCKQLYGTKDNYSFSEVKFAVSLFGRDDLVTSIINIKKELYDITNKLSELKGATKNVTNFKELGDIQKIEYFMKINKKI
jgi:hypothetical protein